MPHWKKNFLIILASQSLSDFTSLLFTFAMTWSLAQATESPMVMSYAMMAQFLPSAIIGPLSGVFIDRYSRKIIMITADIFTSVICAVIVLTGMLESAPVWLLIAIIALRSCGSAVQRPCMQAIIPQIAPKDQLVRCAGYSHTIQSISSLLSPALAAALYIFWDLSHFMWLDIAFAIIAIITLFFSYVPRLEKTESREISAIRGAAEGFRILYRNKGMFGLVLIGALYTAALNPISALFPIMSLSFFGGTSVEAGLSETLFALGMLAGALFISITGGVKNKMRPITFMMFLMSASLIIIGMLPPTGVYIFIAAAFFMGICAPSIWGNQTALLQLNFSPEHMGRVMSLTFGIRVIASPLSLSISGMVSERFGAQTWFLVGGLITLICGLLCIMIPCVRNCDIAPSENPSDAKK